MVFLGSWYVQVESFVLAVLPLRSWSGQAMVMTEGKSLHP
jgi:hypothetical protein